jgi:integrase
MASIKKTSARTWMARWRTPDGQAVNKVFKRKVDAENHLTAIEHSKLMGAYVDPRAGRTTFKGYAESWRAVQIHRASTAAQAETHLRLHVYPRIGNRPLGAIRPSEVQTLVKSLSADLAPSTVEVVYAWVSTIFKAAVADRIITASPCVNVKLPVAHRSQVIPLAPGVVGEIIEGIDERYRAVVVFGAGTGARISEALGLTVDRVDFLRRQVTIDRQLVGVEDDRPVFGPVKDRLNRARTIPLPESVVLALAAHLERYGPGPDGLVFTSSTDRPLRRSTFGGAWRRVCDPRGIAKGDGFHQLRHFYASTLIAAGESVKVVQIRLGHSTATMTLDVYGHLFPGSEERTRVAVDAVLLEALATNPRQMAASAGQSRRPEG